MTEAGRRALRVAGDITQDAHCRELVLRAVQRLGRLDILVNNVIAPGPVWTPLIPSTMPQDQVTTFGQQSPMQRPAQPAELAPTYVFLASCEAGYITGQVIGVTGGSPINSSAPCGTSSSPCLYDKRRTTLHGGHGKS